MGILTSAQIAASCHCPLPRAENWRAVLSDAMDFFKINTSRRQAAFLAQIAHESGGLQFVREIWGPTPTQSRYEGRADLGNTQPGDGYRYRGRGLIQTTGRSNYKLATSGLRALFADTPDFEASPQLLEAPRWAAYSAALFWSRRRLNALADTDQFTLIPKRINGGTNGLDERFALWNSAKAALNISEQAA